MAREAEVQPESAQIYERAERLLVQFTNDGGARDAATAATRGALPMEVVAHLDALLRKADSYRDALLVALAVPLVRGERVDIRVRDAGGRSASDRIGKLLRE